MPESRAIDIKGVRRAALAIAGAIAFAVLAAWLLLRHLGPATNTGPPGAAVPPPRLQTAPVPDRVGYFAEKERMLKEYGWVDRRNGIARIPLDEALRLQAAREDKR